MQRTGLGSTPLTEHTRKLLDRGEYVCGVFVDRKKVTAHHEILCEKIKAQGLRGNVNKLLIFYVTGRKRYVSINIYSDKRNVPCGVPQGSSLGPFFYSLYQ